MKITNMLVQIAQTFSQSFKIRFFNSVQAYSSVHFEPLCCGNNHCQTWLKPALTTFNIIKFLCSQIGTEAGFCDNIISKSHRHFCCQNRVTAMGNISKWATMYKCSGTFGSLYQIRMYSIFQQDSNSPCHAQIFYSKRLVIIGVA